MTSPRPRPDLAPTRGATSCGDLAPTPLPLRGGAMSRGDLNTPTTNPTSPHPTGATSITAHCPTHGRQAFLRCESSYLWACPHFVEAPNVCWSVILDEDVTPDGADVIDMSDWVKSRARTVA